MTQVAVKLNKVSKRYILAHEKPRMIQNIFGRKIKEEFWALKNINLSIKKGEKVGIMGPNGAGKTTLLKIISGITTPTAGKVTTNGKIVSLLDLQAGFHPELTGEENIHLNGMLIGMDKDEIRSRKEEIITFADIGEFIDAPFYTYSAGMKFRLAFSIAIASRCEILIMDEIFVTGDFDFQKKTLSAIKDIQKKNKMTTIVCSHIPWYIWKLSNVFYALDQGKISRKPADEIFKIVKTREKQWKGI